MFRDLIENLDDDANEPDVFLDVPFVPSNDQVIETMLQLAGAGPRDLLYDLGSGDGRIVIAAAKQRRTRGIGIELDPLRIADAMEQAGHAGVEYLVDFVEDNIFTADVSAANIVTLYLMDSINLQLRPRLLRELRPGTRIVSHAFDMGDWIADERLTVDNIKIYKWIVPARVAGTWEWESLDGTLCRIELQQCFQTVSGRVWLSGRPALLNSATLSAGMLELSIQADPESPLMAATLHFDHDELLSVEEAA